MVWVIDGMNAIDACYAFAGITGFDPERFTLRELWQMAEAKAKQRRFELLDAARLPYTENLDLGRYLLFGHFVTTDVGEPIPQKTDGSLGVDEI